MTSYCYSKEIYEIASSVIEISQNLKSPNLKSLCKKLSDLIEKQSQHCEQCSVQNKDHLRNTPPTKQEDKIETLRNTPPTKQEDKIETLRKICASNGDYGHMDITP